MKFRVKKQLFAHDLINPPTEFSSCNIVLLADSHECVLNLEKGQVSHGTSYTLSLEDALQFGFTSAEQSIFVKELRNLILAFNLTLSRVCMTLENFYCSHGGVQIVPPESTIVFRSEVQATVSLSETFPMSKD